ncbi:hypothetical protein [Erythrobacter alti]|uniref:DUF4870 family protein n=1 Tax=Erythrobacter alti TaxID=1896145 RepID=UPI0030F42B34
MTDAPPTPPAPPPASSGVTMQRTFIVALLYLLNIFLGFSVFIGVILAYIWRGEGNTQEWERSHYTYLIRTFWIGLGAMIGFCLMLVATIIILAAAEAERGGHWDTSFAIGAMFIGMALFFLTAIWFCIRSILSMVKSGNREPMPRPNTWLF